MQNEEKLLTIEDAYDAVVDYLEKVYQRTNLDDVGSLLGSMAILEDGKSADPAILKDWIKSVNQVFNKNPNSPKNFESNVIKLSIMQAYKAMINFLEIYNFDEIIILLQNMRLDANEKTVDSSVWTSWIESVEKISSNYPRIRPLFLLLNTKALTIEDAYNTTIDFLSEYYNKNKLNDIVLLLKKMINKNAKENQDPDVLMDWNNAVNLILSKKNESTENGFDATQGYEAMINFLNRYGRRTNSNEIIAMLDGMKLLKEQESKDPKAWLLWLASINKTLNKYRKF